MNRKTYGCTSISTCAALDDKRRGKYNPNPPQKIPTSSVVDVFMDNTIDWIEHKYLWKTTSFYTKGWTVVGIPEYEDYSSQFFSWLESQNSEFKQSDSSTWNKLPTNSRGIFKQHIDQEEWVWKIREMCIPIFEKLYSTKELLCSFDSGCFFPTDSYEENFKHWIHNDYPRNGHGICAQGNDGGLLLVEESEIFMRIISLNISLIGWHANRLCISWERSDVTNSLFSNKRLIHKKPVGMPTFVLLEEQ